MNIRENYESIEDIILSEYAIKSKNSKGREKPEDGCEIRTAFQHDRDRIIHCKSFRRLKHKTQVFLSPEGDHYRTRLTHTLEVSQIARTVARALKLNEDLTEAMALGHDLGHTPFGHAGERALNNISEKGFSHYKQSLRVVSLIEKNWTGLNLTYEVKDGILNHAGSNVAETLEGQIIKFADRTAYINHDIDDAIRAGILSEQNISNDIKEILGTSHSKRINTLINSLIKKSYGKNSISMTSEVAQAAEKLRDQMFEMVYKNKEAKGEEDKAINMIYRLYEHFYNDSSKMPSDYFNMIEKYGKDQIVCDYIAGMTDRFAILTYKNLFIPKVWNVL